MKYIIALASLALLSVSCKESKKAVTNAPSGPILIDVTSLESKEKDVNKYMATITDTELKDMLYVYAGDEMEGRNTGDPGQKKAVAYLRDYYKAAGYSFWN